MKKLIMLFCLINSTAFGQQMMVDINTSPVISTRYSRGELYTSLEFWAALAPYEVVFNPSQIRRLLVAIQKYRELDKISNDEKRDINQKLMTIPFEKIKNQGNQISSDNPSLNVYFISNSRDDSILAFSVSRIQKNTPLELEMFYFSKDMVSFLEDTLRGTHVAKQ